MARPGRHYKRKLASGLRRGCTSAPETGYGDGVSREESGMPWVRAPQSAIRLKVTLKGLKPPIWRRLLVEDTMTLGDLNMAVQAAMGWTNSHLHLFVSGREQIGDPRQFDEVEDEDKVTVGELAALGWKSLAYIYDMGDNWEHTIAIERAEPIDPARAYPACIGGKRACPPEDSGGPWGFADMLEALADPSDDRHADYREWLGEFDAEAFSVEDADARLAAWFRRRKPRARKGARKAPA
jgi:hypothetical protein